MFANARFQSTETTSDFVQNYKNDTIFLKNKHQNRNKHIVMYSSRKIQSIWRTSDFETKFAQKI